MTTATPFYHVTAAGKYLAVVKALPKPRGIAGHWHNGELVQPDMDAIRQALPHYWRAAWDRQTSHQTMWFGGNEYADLTLYSAKGKRLTTIHARFYVYQSEVPA